MDSNVCAPFFCLGVNEQRLVNGLKNPQNESRNIATRAWYALRLGGYDNFRVLGEVQIVWLPH